MIRFRVLVGIVFLNANITHAMRDIRGDDAQRDSVAVQKPKAGFLVRLAALCCVVPHDSRESGENPEKQAGNGQELIERDWSVTRKNSRGRKDTPIVDQACVGISRETADEERERLEQISVGLARRKEEVERLQHIIEHQGSERNREIVQQTPYFYIPIYRIPKKIKKAR